MSFIRSIVSVVLIATVAVGCAQRSKATSSGRAVSHQPIEVDRQSSGAEAVSLLGTPLYVPAMSDEAQAQRERDLELARFDYDRDPHNEDAIIWVGRRLAYLGRYRDAVDVYTNGLAIHPDSHKLLRHRGHRYLTLRQFARAQEDLQAAADLIESRQIPDEVEPDGAPNRLGIPTSTSHTNIYYHLGLAHYLQGDFGRAADAYRRCMIYAKNEDMRVATAYWHYLTLRRAEDHEEAARLLQSISHDMNVIENTSYHRLLLVFKGDMSSDEIMLGHGGADASIDLATIGYGLGVFHLLRGDRISAVSRFQQVVDETNWAAFGHIAAEVELFHAQTNHLSIDVP